MAQSRSAMLNTILAGIRFIVLALGGHEQVALENAAVVGKK
jgi:hypothetical protein